MPLILPYLTDVGPASFSWQLLLRHIKSCFSTWQIGEGLIFVPFIRLLTNPGTAMGRMHPRPWQVRVCAVSPSHSCIGQEAD